MPTSQAAHPRLRPPDRGVRPLDLLAGWPAASPLACLVSAGDSPRARWSIFASPTSVVRCGEETPDPLRILAEAINSTATPPSSAHAAAPPFSGGWIGWLSYDLGRIIEPAAQSRMLPSYRAQTDLRWPLFELLRCPAAYVHDATTGDWHIVGDARFLPALDNPAPPAVFRIDSFGSRSGRVEYKIAAARTIDLIRAGEIFQANIAHRIRAPFRGSTRTFACRMLSCANAWYGSYIESPDQAGRPAIRHAICSASPELFLSYDPGTRRIVTRPIKGTRPATAAAETELAASNKDAAELNMIVDLMRNDLGRVCDYGSIHVDDPRAIEAHGGSETDPRDTEPLGILHGVATISGTLRKSLGIADLLRATFPPGSVTGAPKIRAMQIIDTLEPIRRGPYCGCVGFVSDSGHSAWNVAIRTASLKCTPRSTPDCANGVIDYSVGAGIVADSDPAAEWKETLSKAGILKRAFPDAFEQLDRRERLRDPG